MRTCLNQPAAFAEISLTNNCLTATQAITFRSRRATLDLAFEDIAGEADQDFTETSNSCALRPVPADKTCYIGITFAPKTTGERSAKLLEGAGRLT